MKLDRILELIALQMGDTASESELRELEYLLREHPNHQSLIAILHSIRSKKLKQPAQNEELIVNEGWEKLQQKIKDNNPERQKSEGNKINNIQAFLMRSSLLKVAVVVGLILISGVIIYENSTYDHLKTVSVSETVPIGKPAMKELPDGSVVWINAGSKISYSASRETRDIYLEGEAFFKVQHDAVHPFVVHAGNLEVKALGTEFNVMAYPGDDHVETTLIKGKVQVIMKEKPDQKIILAPNEKLIVVNRQVDNKKTTVKKEGQFEVRPIEILPVVSEGNEVAWTQDKLAFQNESFFKLAKRMERRYNVHFLFSNESLKKETMSGVFENETIEKALHVLQMTTPFEYQIREDSVFIHQR